MKYYKFTERNSWEGEAWNFYVPLTDGQAAKLRDLLEDGKNAYKLSEETFTEEQIDARMAGEHEPGYHWRHNKCEPPKSIPESVDWQNDDPFYKGSFWTLSPRPEGQS